MAPRTWVITAGIVLTAVVLLILIRSSLDDSDAYSSIASALVAIGTAFAGIVLYLSREQRPQAAEQEADALALELLGQWEPEIRHRRRRFGDQRLIPLGWTGTGIGPVRVRLSGRLDGNPDAAATRLADAFDQLPSRRLVVIGEPGSGKTFLGAMLTVGLLRRRTAGAAVPVFLSLSSWDPVAEGLDDWLVRTIATTYYNGRQQAAKALLVSRLLLPVLDGLDELPDHARRRAVNRLNDVLDDDRPLVLTCRIAEYEDLVAGGAPTLLRAPVVRIDPVTTADIVTQLRSWPGIASHVRREPDGPVATALSTPLMLSLFAAAYRDRSPDELLSPVKFTSRHAVEDHLVDLLVDTLYPDPRHRRWLTYLAQVLHRNDDHDFRWWQLARRTLSPWIAPVLGLLVAAVAFAVVTWSKPTPSYSEANLDPAVQLSGTAPLVATLFGVVVMSLWLASSGREPGPVSGERGFGRGVVTGAALVLVPGVPILLIGTIEGDRQIRSVLMPYTGALLALAVVAGLGVGLHELLAARIGRAGKASPEDFLRQDRASALTSAAVIGLVVGALTVAACTLGAALGGHLGERFASTEHFPAAVHLSLPPLQTHVPWKLSSDNAAALVVTSALFVALFAVAVLTTRAWTRFLVARAVLALAGRLPWRLMRFLADARERGLLRIASGGYQFWHVRLQERLVMKAGHQRARRRPPRAAVAGFVVVSLVLAAAAVWAAGPDDCRRTGWSEVDQRMVRVTYRSASVCSAHLTRDDWQRRLAKPAGDGQLLAQIAGTRQRLAPPFFKQITVLGDLRNADPLRWQETLRGLVAAQNLSESALVIEFAHSDAAGHESSHDLDVALRHYVDKGPSAGLSEAAVVLEGTTSTVFPEEEHPSHWMIVGSRDTALSSIATSLKNKLINDLGAVPHAHLTDGVSQEECAGLRDQPPPLKFAELRIDLRGASPAPDLLVRLASCAQNRVMAFIEEQHAGLIRLPRNDLGAITSAYYIKDRSATITHDCEAKLSAPVAVNTCVAALMAAERARVEIVWAAQTD